ncbi:uncharacterized protein LOC123505533 isoform X2 [Portunus trituberculatus]|uniref:uncharacterized protein LOC123505533 isoform X2 n=1 Tax=Portunus trituberculatus TaxID=210409 RepID=UPI001E1CE779|nr:uncharacterized protein LOC123505533 isoform X2 [Portunus trituberculatus]
MTRDSGLEAGWAAAGCGRGRLHWAWRRGVGVCLVMVAASFCFFLVSSPHRARLSFFIHSLPEYNDFLMPSNTSVPLSPSSPQASPGTFHQSTGVTKGFLVHSPSCSIPDLDPMHYTVKRFVSKPKPIICGKPPAFTSARGSTLYLHRDILRLHFTALERIYKTKLTTEKTKTAPSAKPKPTTTTRPKTNTDATVMPAGTKASKTTILKPRTTSPTTAATLITTTTTTATTSLASTPSKSQDPSPSPPPPPPPSPPPSAPPKNTKKSAEVKITPEDVKCCYKEIYRVQQKRKNAGGNADNRWRYNNTCKAINDTEMEIGEEAALVECRIGTVVVYKNVHYFFHKKNFLSASRVILSMNLNVQVPSPSSEPLVAQVASEGPSPQGNIKTNKTTELQPAPKTVQSAGNSSTPKPTSNEVPASTKPPVMLHRVKDSEKLNVIIMGTDSASRLNMLRHLSKTYEYLTKELGAVDLKGYNKVGDNTFPNLMPILGGMTIKEVDQATCVTKSKHYDDCHWVWKDFKKSKYVTAYMEDSPWMGSFHYLRRGFIEKPTDFYGRPFMMASEKEIGGPGNSRGHFCQGNVLSIKVVQDYALEFARTFHSTPFFGFFWSSSLTHDHLNLLELTDDHYFQYLQQMEKIGALNNTALFFISDHGMRWGGIRSTYIGMLEERLPYVVLYLPPWFRKKYHQAYEHLASNTHRLTSNFDVYETLLDLAYGRFADPAYVTSTPSRTKRGTSLFRNIPWNRSCVEANIPTHFCSCQDTHELTEEDPYLVPAADRFLDMINDQLLPYSQCEQFTKIKVMSARVSIPNKELKPKEEKSEVRTYLLQAALLPGNVIVEVSMRHTNHDDSFQMLGNASRINKYGSTSACIQDDTLRKYCYCKDQKRAKQLYNQHYKEQLGTEVGNNTRARA